MADLFSALGRTPLNLDRTRRPADPETALPGLVPPAVTRAAADPEAWGQDVRPAAPARLDDQIEMRPGADAAMDGGEDPLVPVGLPRGGAAAAGDQLDAVVRAAQGNGRGSDRQAFRHE